MNKKTTAALSRIILASFVMLLSIAAVSSATDIIWDNGAGDYDWNNGTNWNPDGVPGTASTQNARINMAAGPVFSTGRTATAYRIYLEGANGTITMNDGGSLTTVNHVYMAALSTDTAILNMSGGTINIGSTSFHSLYCGFSGAATLNMSGGAINLSGTFNVALNTGSNGTVNLSGGTITCKALSMRASPGAIGTINITSGTLIIDSNGAANLSTYITSGWIKAYDGAVEVIVDVNNINPNKTTVWASTPTKAVVLSPADNAANVSILTNLSWIGVPGATSHDVYFGTSSSPAFVSNQTGTTFDPGILDFNTTYYWRIDEIIGPDTVTGDMWTFSTVSGLAENPDPVSGATEVALNKVLSWTPGYGAVSHDVYFGTDADAVRNAERLEGDLDGDGRVDYNDIHILANYWLENPAGSEPYAGVNDDNIVDFADYALLANNWMVQPSPLLRGNTTDTRYNDPCDFAINTTYYWRVDEVNSTENRKGDVWSFTTTPYSDSLFGKVMCGYQGWFNCPGDGTTRNWVHWSKNNSSFTPLNPHVDFWPDMTEYGADEKFLTGFDEGSTHFYVFSSHNRNTVLRHFQWMRDYDIDGVYLQRFATEIKSQTSTSFYHRNDVLDYCKDGANMYGRKYAVMYDLSKLKLGETSYVINDWKYLVDIKHVTIDPNYMRHRDKPVVAVWGIGFSDGRAYTLAECLTLVNFLRNDPVYGGNIVMVGVPSYWRTLTNDCLPDPMVHTIVRAADIVSPWSVGRYSTSAGAAIYADNVWTPDVNWCEANSTPSHPIEYLPVIFPGYSFHNADPVNKLFNEIPRNGGQFFWDQVKGTVATAGANMLYVAMFDEVDEGTAIFKVTNNPPRPGGVDMFLTPSYDGIPLPSDEYLWLTGQAGRALRGEISPVPSTRPAR